MKAKTWIFAAILVVAVIAGIFVGNPTGHITKGFEDSTIVKLKTSEGNIWIALYNDTPITTDNFEKLVKEGFYDGLTFHRVVKDFVIQGGDPTGTGGGGSGYNIQDEFIEGHSNLRGTISMANTGQPNSGGSQFFINLKDNTRLDFNKEPLTSKHPVFGEVIKGMNVVDKISKVDTNGNPPVGTNKPLKDVVILKATIIN